MADHLSALQIKNLCASALPEDELAAAGVHTANCQSCHQRFVEELRLQRGATPFTFTLEPEFWFRDDHVDFDLLVALADATIDQETQEIVDIHLRSCESCREDVRSFLAFRESDAGELDTVSVRREYESTHRAGAVPLWQRLQLRPVYAVAAVVLLALTVLIGVIALKKGSGWLEANKQDQIIPGTDSAPRISPSLVPNASASPPIVDDSSNVARLNDRDGEVTIDKNGRVTGLDEASEKSREYIARAALAERVQPAEVLRRLSGDQTGLRAEDNGPPEFRLSYPLGSVIIEDRPVFRWESLPSAASYRVYVMDANGKQVRQSEELVPTQTQWKPPRSFQRGQIFSWVVMALVDGKKIVSPSASAPEIKFAVLSSTDFEELARLRKVNSHFALGVFYARTGLLNEAEREFEDLVRLNPDSELPRKLLQSVRGIRKENEGSFR